MLEIRNAVVARVAVALLFLLSVTVLGNWYVIQTHHEMARFSSDSGPWWYHVAEVAAILSLVACVLIHAASRVAGEAEQQKIARDLAKIDFLDTERQRFAAIAKAADRTGVVMVTFDEYGTICLATDSAAQLLRYTPETLVGSSVFDLVDPDQCVLVRQHVRDIHHPSWSPVRVRLALRTDLGGTLKITMNVHRFVSDGRVYGVATSIRPFRKVRRGQFRNAGSL